LCRKSRCKALCFDSPQLDLIFLVDDHVADAALQVLRWDV
jgi:hypothetical protein